MRDCTIEVETLSAVLRKTAHLKLPKKSEEIGQLIAKKSIRQKEKWSQNPLLLFPCFPVVGSTVANCKPNSPQLATVEPTAAKRKNKPAFPGKI